MAFAGIRSWWRRKFPALPSARVQYRPRFDLMEDRTVPAAVVDITPSIALIADSDVGDDAFTLTIVYDEAMNETSTPTISFPTDDPTAPPVTLALASGAWFDSMTYIATYDVLDANVFVADIDVEVTGALDSNDVLQDPGTVNDVFSIDTENPTVVSVTPSDTLLTDAEVGGVFTLTVVFSEAMDETVDPTIDFPNDDLASSLSFVSGAWSDSITYVATYDILDGNVTLPNIDVQVAGGEDLAGNLQEQGDFAAVFSIDTENPTVVSVTPSVAVITDAQVGAGNFTLTIVFSEDMDQTIDPTITFPGADPSGTLTFAGGLWANATTYLATYDVVDANDTISDIDVQVNGAEDLVGNPQEQGDFPAVFSIDTESPTVVSVTPSAAIITDANVGAGGFTLTIVFSEDMDQTVDPPITFPGADPSGTITFASGQWTNATTYVATYNVADIDTMVADVDVTVDGGEDVAGNPQIQGDFLAVFSIDTASPAAVSVTPSVAVISPAQVGGTFTLTIVFNEEMDQTIDPTVSFPNDDLSGTLTFNAGLSGWTDGFTYEAVYDVVDDDATIIGIDVRVADAENLANVPQAQGDFPAVFSIDTENPTVVSVTPSVPVIADAQAGAGGFTLTIVFSEDMDQTVDPTIAFPGADPSGTLTFVSGQWTNATTYVATYDVVDANVSIADIDVQVTGGEDVAGNPQVQGDFAAVFSIDTENPTVVSVTPSITVINDAATGGVFTLTIVFSEDMDETVDPTIAFLGANPTAAPATLVFVSGEWTNSTTYVATYDTLDVNVTQLDIGVRVTGAENLVGNANDPADFAAVFSIDTQNPTVVSVTRLRFNARKGIMVYQVKFSEAVTGVNVSDFDLVRTGSLASANIANVSGSGDTWKVKVKVGTGLGTLQLNVLDDDTIVDLNGNPLAGPFTGPVEKVQNRYRLRR